MKISINSNVGMFFKILILFFVVFVATSAISAADYYTNPNGSDSDNGQSISTAKQSLANVTEAANWGDTIYLSSGTFNGSKNRDIIINKDLTFIGDSVGVTVIDGEFQGRIFNIFPDCTVTFKNIVFKNGYVTGDGGAIYNNGGGLIIENCQFTDNTASNRGGAIFNAWAYNVNIKNTSFKNNQASDGGSIYNFYGGSFTIKHTQFTNNIAVNRGGAIFNEQSHSFEISSSYFNNNSATNGGAIYNFYGNQYTINSSSFISNNAENNGDAIFNEYGENFKINSSYFNQNPTTNNIIFNHNSIDIISFNNTLRISNSVNNSLNLDDYFDTIQIFNSSYGSVYINRNVTLIGLDNALLNRISIDSGGNGSTIKGFSNISYLSLYSVDYCNIINNTFNDSYGMSIIYLFDSHNNLFLENIMNGIILNMEFSNNNALIKNNMNFMHGGLSNELIGIIDSENITLTGNNMEILSSQSGFMLFSNSVVNFSYNRLIYLNNLNYLYIGHYGSYVDLNDNWWGTNDSIADLVYGHGTGTILLDSWITIKESLINNDLVIDLNHNNNGLINQDYHIIDGIPIIINNQTFYTVNGQVIYSDAINQILNISVDGYFYILNTNDVISRNVVNLNNGYSYSTLQEAIDDPLTVGGDVIEIIGNLSGSVLINKNLTIISNTGSWFSQVSITELGSGSRLINFNINQQLTLNDIFDFEIINSTIAYQLMIYNSQNIILENNKIGGFLVYILNSADIQIKNNNIYLVRTMPHFPGIIHLVNSDNVNICQNNISLVGMTIENSQVNINFNNIQREMLLYSNSPVNVNNNWWGIYKITNTNNNIQNDSYLTITEKITNNNTLIIDFTINNQGINTSTQGHIPDGIPVVINNGTTNTTLYTKNGRVEYNYEEDEYLLIIVDQFSKYVNINELPLPEVEFTYTIEIPTEVYVIVGSSSLPLSVFPYREINITMNNQTHFFYWKYPKKGNDHNGTDSFPNLFGGRIFFIHEDGTIQMINSLSEINSSGISIYTSTEGQQLGVSQGWPIIITYHGYCHDIDDFNVVFNQTHDDNGVLIPGTQGIYLELNEVNKAIISFSMALPEYNDRALLTILSRWIGINHPAKDIIRVPAFMEPWFDYYGFSNFKSDVSELLKFYNTQEPVFNRKNPYSIESSPSIEYVNTKLVFNGQIISNTEAITFGLDYGSNINYDGGFYGVSNLTVTITANDNQSQIFFSFDNGTTWQNRIGNVSILFYEGIWDLQYYITIKGISTGAIYNFSYIIDNSSPIVWTNLDSGVYNETITINFTVLDNIDTDPVIYYTLDGSIPNTDSSIYNSPIIISNSTTLRYFSIDKFGNKGEINTNYYIYSKVGNLDTGKGYNTIQDAIDDPLTIDGHIIEVQNGNYLENIILNKSLVLLGVEDGEINIRPVFDDKPIFNITSNGNGSIIRGFNIIGAIYSYGIDLTGVSDCTVIKNVFIDNFVGVFSDSSEVISKNNWIKNNTFINRESQEVSGISLSFVEDYLIANNILLINTYQPNGIEIFCSKNVFIHDNYVNMTNIGINVSFGSNITLMNNILTGNEIGIYLYNTKNNTISENTVIKNSEGIKNYYIDESNVFSYNRIWENSIFGLVACSSNITATNNWWGNDNPITNIISNIADIYIDNESNVNYNPYIIVILYPASYKVENGEIYEITMIADLNYNSNGEDISIWGCVPDGIPIYFAKNLINLEEINLADLNLFYTKNGKSSAQISINNNSDITVFAFVDNAMINTPIVNNTASAKIVVFSTAIDVTGESLYFTYELSLNESVSWISLLWTQVDYFTSNVSLIVNGEIVESKEVVSSGFIEYYTQFSDNFFWAVYENNNALFNLNYLTSLYDLYPELRDSPSYETFLGILKEKYNLTDYEINFIKENNTLFHDNIFIAIDYPGDEATKISVNNEIIEFLGNSILRFDKITYINGAYVHRDDPYDIIQEHIQNQLLISFLLEAYHNFGYQIITMFPSGFYYHIEDAGYDGVISFAFVTTKITNDTVEYWLNQKDTVDSNGELLYSNGPFKAAYGTFLAAFLVIATHDLVADTYAARYNVTWNRTTPIVVCVIDGNIFSLITGEMDHRMGMDVEGLEENVKTFKFMCSLSFPLAEQWIMKAMFPTENNNGALDIINSFFDGKPIDIISEDRYLLLKETNDSITNVLLFDLETGLFRDQVMKQLSNISGAYCYSNQQTEWGWNYGRALNQLNSFLNSIGMSDITQLSLAFTNLRTDIVEAELINGLITFLSPINPVANWAEKTFITGNKARTNTRTVIDTGLLLSNLFIGISGAGSGINDYFLNRRDTSDDNIWQYYTIGRPYVWDTKTIFVQNQNNWIKDDYIEIPYKGHGWELDRDNAIYIDGVGGKRNMTRAETYKYI